ncbi:MAG: hypothetical protein L0I29_20375, partial [Hyphomicrobiales bacterium]|nr:hypothetical protein [Hyphomicrobiales bacterium]
PIMCVDLLRLAQISPNEEHAVVTEPHVRAFTVTIKPSSRVLIPRKLQRSRPPPLHRQFDCRAGWAMAKRILWQIPLCIFRRIKGGHLARLAGPLFSRRLPTLSRPLERL